MKGNNPNLKKENLTKEVFKMLYVDKIVKNAKLPEKAHNSDAGYDIFSVEKVAIPAKQRAIIHTGIKLETDVSKLIIPPVTMYWRIAPRSGLACKHGIDVLAGVVDINYRGEIMVCLFNSSDEEYTVAAGDKIAQMIPTIALTMQVQEAKISDKTDRGSKGFGSSGN